MLKSNLILCSSNHDPSCFQQKAWVSQWGKKTVSYEITNKQYVWVCDNFTFEDINSLCKATMANPTLIKKRNKKYG